MYNVATFVGSAVLSGLGSRLAAGHSAQTLRIPIMAGRDSVVNDWRTMFGLGGAILTALIPEKHAVARGAAFSVGLGAATSLAATESVRAHTVAQLTASPGGAAPGPSASGPRLLSPPVAGPSVTPLPTATPVRASGYGVW